ncbi:MAG: hypothetical protein FWD67_09470 [Betaproteobacteria bacterium]|nr:hypothetical protein [Betaproteobacteria bacterium]
MEQFQSFLAKVSIKIVALAVLFVVDIVMMFLALFSGAGVWSQYSGQEPYSTWLISSRSFVLVLSIVVMWVSNVYGARLVFGKGKK